MVGGKLTTHPHAHAAVDTHAYLQPCIYSPLWKVAVSSCVILLFVQQDTQQKREGY